MFWFSDFYSQIILCFTDYSFTLILLNILNITFSRTFIWEII